VEDTNMQYEYILCEFTYGYVGKFYQEISGGSVQRLRNEDGTDLILPLPGDPGFVPYGTTVIDANPPRPVWAE
jgi:hypothetical protein